MRTAIIGAGAIGSFLGALLYNSGYDVRLIGREAHVNKINERGLIIQQGSAKQQGYLKISQMPIKVPSSVQSDSIGSVDLAIVATKAYSTHGALSEHESVISRDTKVLTLQNGLGQKEIVEHYLEARFNSSIAQENNYGGISSYGIAFIEPGTIRYNGEGKVVVGSYSGEDCSDIVAMFQKADLMAEASEDIIGAIWTKLLVNVGISALATYHSVCNGELVTREDLKKDLLGLVAEGYKVAMSLGINVPDDIGTIALEVAEATANNTNSMLQDIQRERKTEIDEINLQIIIRADQLGIPIPLNQKYYNLIKEIEKKHL